MLSFYRNGKGNDLLANFVRSLLKSESGATAIEYGLIAALIAVACITAITSIGTSLSTTFTSVANSL